MLTGLPNRARLRHLISEAIEACPDGNRVALAFLDIDKFSTEVNADVDNTLMPARRRTAFPEIEGECSDHSGRPWP